jgi:hypothetical protein
MMILKVRGLRREWGILAQELREIIAAGDYTAWW